MRIYEIQLFREQSFIDDEVSSMDVDYDRKICKININGGYIVLPNKQAAYIDNVIMTVSEWSDVRIIIGEIDSKQYLNEHPDSNDKFQSICQMFVNKDIELRGFNIHTQMEWIFFDAKIEIIAEPSKEEPWWNNS